MPSPKTTKCLVLRRAAQAQPKDSVYHDIEVSQRDIPALKDGEILVQISAVAFNHRDIFIRKNLYPSIAMDSVMGADGAGLVIDSANPNDELLGKRVILVPMRGWEKSRRGPEQKFGILGGCTYPQLGTFSEYVVVERTQVIPTPEHLDDEHAAAWPLGGVTAWRAVVVKGEIEKGDNVLITGIGGGVALTALQLCVALGANVWVTSGDESKIQKAISLGAKGGVIYKNEKWPAELGELLKKSGTHGQLNAIIDSAGGEICAQTTRLVALGARVVVFGMTAAPKVSFTMREVLKNVELRGSTMGSHKELLDATAFLTEHKIVPVVSDIIDGLDKHEEGFELMSKGGQVGKIVISVKKEEKGKL